MPNDQLVPNTGFLISNNLYSKTKWFTMIVLPALSTLCFTLGTIWNLPNVQEVIGTIAAITTFLGVILGISTKAYNKSNARYDGTVNIYETDHDTILYSLDLNDDVQSIDDKTEVVFRVNPQYRK